MISPSNNLMLIVGGKLDKKESQCAGSVILLGRSMIVLVRPLDQTLDEWLLPKGHVKEGESLTDAAIREAEEETGAVCSIEDPGPIHVTSRETETEIQTTTWYLLRAAALKTERAEILVERGYSRRHVGIFPTVVALARLTFQDQRDVLARILGGETAA
jgi:8-oxo-dGTP pyrophosphatase MutT (NUDIX family)